MNEQELRAVEREWRAEIIRKLKAHEPLSTDEMQDYCAHILHDDYDAMFID